MKNKTAIIVTALLCLCTVIFATEKVQEPGKNQVLLVGRVSLLKDLDRDFYIQTLGLDPSLRDKNHTYGFLPDPKRDDILTVPIDTVIGDYFFIPVKIPKTGRFPLQGFFVFLFSEGEKRTGIIGKLYLARARCIYLPFGMEVPVSSENRYVYVGSYTYSFAGDNFVVDGIKQRDEFDEAQALLNQKLGKNVQLTRAVLLDPEESQKKTK